MADEPGPGEVDEPVIWMRPERPARGKAPAYSRADLASAAVRIADADGLDAVSMRRVAAEIGAGTMSLYRYVRSRGELLALMVDSLAEWTDEDTEHAQTLGWAAYLRVLAVHSRQLVLDHPWFSVATTMAGAPGPNTLRAMDSSLAVLDRPELTIDETFQILLSVIIFAQGFAQHELAERASGIASGGVEETTTPAEQAWILHMVESGNFPYLTKVVVEAASPHQDADAQFLGVLDWLVTGIEAHVSSRGTS